MFKKKRLNDGKKAQTWSIDLVVGVVVFLLLVVILYALLNQKNTEDKNLRQESQQVVTRFDTINSDSSGLPGLINGDDINETALKQLYSGSLDYKTVKEKLGLKGNFCILVIDDTGGIVEIDAFGTNKLSFGSAADNLAIASGKVCGN